jgi:agmatinase
VFLLITSIDFLEALFIMKSSISVVFGLAALVAGHGAHDQTPIEGPHKSLWYNTLPGDGGTQV